MKKKMNYRLYVSDFRTFSSLDLSAIIRNKYPRMSMFMVNRTDENIEYESVSFIYATDILARLNVILTDSDLIDEVFEASTECNISRVVDDSGECIRHYVREAFLARLSIIFHQWNESNAVLKIAGIMK
jgi:hypothetical protein